MNDAIPLIAAVITIACCVAVYTWAPEPYRKYIMGAVGLLGAAWAYSLSRVSPKPEPEPVAPPEPTAPKAWADEADAITEEIRDEIKTIEAEKEAQMESGSLNDGVPDAGILDMLDE